jgi:hypothetical protein
MWYLHKRTLAAKASTTEEPDAGKTARPGLCGGRPVMGVPTARDWGT